jgi:hypothetical protein
MNTILQQVQQHASGLPLTYQAELLHYTLYLERKAQGSSNVSRPINREQLAQALEQAVALNPYGDIADPVSWQQEQRQDRPLPGRKHAD